MQLKKFHITRYMYVFLRTFVFLAVIFLSVDNSFGQSTSNVCLANTKFTIAVLGSSTAAGTGPSSPDSAWVNRYRKALQQINPENEVINLAVGGYVTYQIMPSNFIPSVSGRPLPDSAHNITKALSYSPDAIIINLPSNDRFYPPSEQLNNFDSLFRHGFNNGVPVWICTTQPIGETNWADYQIAVKDSIIQKFGDYAIDFWTTLADENGVVNPIYAADDVHLNDAGHAILIQRVLTADIPDRIYTPLSFPDYTITKIYSDYIDPCGGTTVFSVVCSNIGVTGNLLPEISFQSTYNGETTIQIQSTPDTIRACSSDTLNFVISASEQGWYYLKTIISSPEDSNSSNDSLEYQFYIAGTPSLQVINDTVSSGDTFFLQAQTSPMDSLFWYSDPQGENNIGTGSSFTGGPVTENETFYVQATRGLLSYKNSLLTTTSLLNRVERNYV